LRGQRRIFSLGITPRRTLAPSAILYRRDTCRCLASVPALNGQPVVDQPACQRARARRYRARRVQTPRRSGVRRDRRSRPYYRKSFMLIRSQGFFPALGPTPALEQTAAEPVEPPANCWRPLPARLEPRRRRLAFLAQPAQGPI
jgi:hypothetical protein